MASISAISYPTRLSTVGSSLDQRCNDSVSKLIGKATTSAARIDTLLRPAHFTLSGLPTVNAGKSSALFRVNAKAGESLSDKTEEVLVKVCQFDTLSGLSRTFNCGINDWTELNPEVKKKPDLQISEGTILRVPRKSWDGVVPEKYTGRMLAHWVPVSLSGKLKSADDIIKKSVHSEVIVNKQIFQRAVGFADPELFGRHKESVVLLLGAIFVSGGIVLLTNALYGKKKANETTDLQFNGNGRASGTVGLSSVSPVTVLEQLGHTSEVVADKDIAGIVGSEGNVISELIPLATVEAVLDIEKAPVAVSSDVDTVIPAEDIHVEESTVTSAAKPSFLDSIVSSLGQLTEKSQLKDSVAENGSLTSKSSSEPKSSKEPKPSSVSRKNEFDRKVRATIPAVALISGAAATFSSGYEGAFEIMGFTAVAAFTLSELLFADKREEFKEDLLSIRSHQDLINFLNKRDILPKD